MPRFFAGYKLHLSLYLSQFLGTMTCIRRAVLLEEEKDKEIIPKWKNANGSLVDFCRLRP